MSIKQVNVASILMFFLISACYVMNAKDLDTEPKVDDSMSRVEKEIKECRATKVPPVSAELIQTKPSKIICVFATNPLPPLNPDGSRGATYPGHGSARDYPAWPKTSVHAMADCVRIRAIENSECGFGIALACDFGGELMQVNYCHLRQPAENKEIFMMGELVGLSGNTGHSSGPHLHISLFYLWTQQPVPDNNPDVWFRDHNCYNDPVPTIKPAK